MPIASSSLTESMDQPPSRYIVGIDLGTTNSAVAWVDTESKPLVVCPYPVEQLTDWSSMERRDTLPSFHYQLTGNEQAGIQNRWIEKGKHPCIVGALARDRGLEMPGRQISSAKSWLCHAGVDRSAAFLPWHGDEDVEFLSPVEASATYLQHIRYAWNRDHPDHLLEDQDIVVTLPASFDEVARELTVEAAKRAGLSRLVLLEEPQAAFYAWLNRHGREWVEKIVPGQTILVCDIGGGTTDFTLIRVKSDTHPSTADTSPGKSDLEEHIQRLHRVAVGEHLILGGDNLDLALAKAAENKLKESGLGNLSHREWDSLRQHCRVAKELLLGQNPPSQHAITLVGSGSKLLSQTKSVVIDQPMVESVLMDGFFPWCELTERPTEATTGFQEFGLPYATEPAVTRHLASFLWSHRWDGRDECERQSMTDRRAARPDLILFNGGVLEAEQIRNRIVGQLQAWFQSTEGSNEAWTIEELKGNRLDLAVAQGAAYFGLVRRGEGVRIDASLARSYYLQVSQDPAEAICLVPGDSVPGDRFRLDNYPFHLMLGQPVQFPIWYSSTRLADELGQLVAMDPQAMKPLPPIRTVLELPKSRKAERVPVIMEVELTEIGTLQLGCSMQESAHRWKLDFDVRSTTETDREAHGGAGERFGIVDQEQIDGARQCIAATFGPEGSESPKGLLRRLTDTIGVGRSEWRPTLLRAMWSHLMEVESGRSKSLAHEVRWLNLVGFCLRPGFGLAADDWRVATTWRKVQGRLFHKGTSSASEAIILWRRIAGGFTPGQQKALFQELLPRLRSLLNADSKGTTAIATNEAVELMRLAGSLELLSATDKSWLAKSTIAALGRKKFAPLIPAGLWLIGRVGARVPIYGPVHQLVPASQVQSWIEQIIAKPLPVQEKGFCLMLLARRTGDRYRDLTEGQRQAIVGWMEAEGLGENAIRLVKEISDLDDEQQNQVIGESLPLGLRLIP